jgi:putative ABC transport system permease protein
MVETLANILRTPVSEHWHMLKQDTVYALRLMTRNLGFTAITLITLALGVGANTAIFSLIHGILLQPLPYTQGDQLVILRQELRTGNIPNLRFSVSEIDDYRQQSQALSDLVEYHTMRFLLLGHGTADRVRTGVVSWNFFDFLGVKPVLGRNFLSSDERPGAPPVVLLSYEYWQTNQHGDPDIVGKVFAMNDKEHTVIGVLPPFPQYPNNNDLYMTTTSCPFRSNPGFIQNRDARMMSVFAKRKPGVTLAQANTDLGVITTRLQQQYPGSYRPGAGYTSVALSLKDELTRTARPTLILLLCAAIFVLLIACANVANFTLARMSQRDQEFTVRSALGAGRGRLLRQLLTESMLLGLCAAALGLLLAIFSHKLLVQFVSRFTPRANEITIDGSVLLFALGAAIFTSIVTGSSIAFSTKNQMVTGLKESGNYGSTMGTRKKQVRNFLVVAQVTFAFVLLIAGGLMLRSFINLQNVDPGFVPQRVLTMAIDLNWSKYSNEQLRRNASRAILDKVQALPGVLSVATSSSFPLDPDAITTGPNTFNQHYQIEGKPLREGEIPPVGTVRRVSLDYFKTLGIPLLQGRLFAPTDNTDAPSVRIISQALAQRRFAGESPIGRRLSGDGGLSWVTIVGVVGNTKEFGLNEDSVEEIYAPMEQVPVVGDLLVRTAADPMTLANQVRNAVHKFDPETGTTNVQTLENARSDTLSFSLVMTDLLGIFAGLALVIAASGIGGILALSVSQRMHEIGVRLALGAKPSHVRNMVIRQGMLLVLGGLGFGVAVALAMTKLLKTFLFKVSATDPWTAGGVCILLALTALVACYIPALRATRIDPLIALRHE